MWGCVLQHRHFHKFCPSCGHMPLRTVPYFVCNVVSPFGEMSVMPDKQRVMCGKLDGLQKLLAKHLQGSSSASPVLHFNLVWPEVPVHLQSLKQNHNVAVNLCQHTHSCPAQLNTARSTKIENLARWKIKPLAQQYIPSMLVPRSTQHTVDLNGSS